MRGVVRTLWPGHFYPGTDDGAGGPKPSAAACCDNGSSCAGRADHCAAGTSRGTNSSQLSGNASGHFRASSDCPASGF